MTGDIRSPRGRGIIAEDSILDRIARDGLPTNNGTMKIRGMVRQPVNCYVELQQLMTQTDANCEVFADDNWVPAMIEVCFLSNPTCCYGYPNING